MKDYLSRINKASLSFLQKIVGRLKMKCSPTWISYGKKFTFLNTNGYGMMLVPINFPFNYPSLLTTNNKILCNEIMTSSYMCKRLSSTNFLSYSVMVKGKYSLKIGRRILQYIDEFKKIRLLVNTYTYY